MQENVFSINYKLILTKIFQFSIFVAIAVAAPYFLNQLITGSIINALLFISAVMLGLEYALFLCFIPSLISLYTGLLPFSVAPIIPFIIMGNMILVLVFSKLKFKNFFANAIPAAAIKFLFIFFAGWILFKNISLMISWPQLLTVLAGAIIAYLFLKIIKKI